MLPLIINQKLFTTNNNNNNKSLLWMPSSLVYTDLDGDFSFGLPFDPNAFDEIDEPPPVHIIYPRPSKIPSSTSLSNNSIVSKFYPFITIILCICIS